MIARLIVELRGLHDDGEFFYLGLLRPSSVSVSVSEPVAQEDELAGVVGSERAL